MKKIVSLLLVISMVLIIPSTVFAQTVETSGEISTISVEGSVTPATFTVTVPTSLSFSINPNNAQQVTTVSAPIENKSSLAVDVDFLGFKSTATTKTKVVAPNTYTDEQWAKLSKSDTENKIALGIKEGTNTYWSATETGEVPNANIGSMHLDAMGSPFAQKSIVITAKTCKAWEAVKTLDYNMYLSIKLSDTQEPTPVPPETTDPKYIKFDKDTGTVIGFKMGAEGYGPENIIIPSTIDGVKVTTIGGNPNSNLTSDYVKSITLPDTITTILMRAFALVPNMKTVNLTNSITRIDDYAFVDANSLQTITIPDGVTKLYNYCFYKNYQLKTINVRKPKDSISGAPWGAPNATVNWDYKGE